MTNTTKRERYYPPSPSDEATSIVHVIWCSRHDCECFDPACREHGCMAKNDGDAEQEDEK